MEMTANNNNKNNMHYAFWNIGCQKRGIRLNFSKKPMVCFCMLRFCFNWLSRGTIVVAI